jgi:hypothetical protein
VWLSTTIFGVRFRPDRFNPSSFPIGAYPALKRHHCWRAETLFHFRLRTLWNTEAISFPFRKDGLSLSMTKPTAKITVAHYRLSIGYLAIEQETLARNLGYLSVFPWYKTKKRKWAATAIIVRGD